MPTDTTYPIGAAAMLVGKPGPALPVNTIRNWTRLYAAHLSPSANPAQKGIERRYTERDIAVLRTVRQLREDRIPLADIAARLEGLTFPVMDVLPASESTESPPEAATIASEPLQLPAPMVDDLFQRLRASEGLADKVAGLDRRLAAVEERRHTRLLMLAAFLLGAGIVAFAVWLASALR